MNSYFPKKDKALSALYIRLLQKSAALGSSHNKITRRRLADVMRRVSCYYMLLNIGLHAGPGDIESADRKEFSDDPDRAALHKWCYSFIQSLKMIDVRLLSEPDLNVSTKSYLQWMHSLFYRKIPPEYLRVPLQEAGKTITINPEKMPSGAGNGQDEAAFRNFEMYYSFPDLAGERLTEAALASHARLFSLFPVRTEAEIMACFYSHSFFRLAGLDSFGLWSLPRAIFHNRDKYTGLMKLALKSGENAGSPARLKDFVTFMGDISEREMAYMERITSQESFIENIRGYVNLRSRNMIRDEKPIREEAKYVLTETMLRGQITRGEAKQICGLGERTARSLLSSMLDEGLLVSENHKSPVQFAIPSKVIGYYLPGLYPEMAV